MHTKFVIDTKREPWVAVLTLWCDLDIAELPSGALDSLFRAECATHTVAARSTMVIEIQPSLIGQSAEIVVAAFVEPASRPQTP